MNKEEQSYKFRALSPLRIKARREEISKQLRKDINGGELNDAIEAIKEHMHDLMYIADLTDKESQVLLQLFAGETFPTIAEREQCTRQCIAQTKNNALRKIKWIMQDKELEEYHTLIETLPYLHMIKTLLEY
jgi:DNA-directed RNA polymerase sigma subunit (sigma70/sigma32)